MKTIISLLLLGFFNVNAQTPDGKEILRRIDQNMSSENRIFTSKMIIHGQRNSRTVESKTWTSEKRNRIRNIFSRPGTRERKC